MIGIIKIEGFGLALRGIPINGGKACGLAPPNKDDIYRTPEFNRILIIQCFLNLPQAVCYPMDYTSRSRQCGHSVLITSYVLPSVFFSIILNIPRVLEISPLGPELQEYRHYLSFYMYYQVRNMRLSFV